jgi:hypothetical protein
VFVEGRAATMPIRISGTSPSAPKIGTNAITSRLAVALPGWR